VYNKSSKHLVHYFPYDSVLGFREAYPCCAWVPRHRHNVFLFRKLLRCLLVLRNSIMPAFWARFRCGLAPVNRGEMSFYEPQNSGGDRNNTERIRVALMASALFRDELVIDCPDCVSPLYIHTHIHTYIHTYTHTHTIYN